MLNSVVILFTVIMLLTVLLCLAYFFRVEIFCEKRVVNRSNLTRIVLIVFVCSIAYGSLILTNHYSVDSFNLVFDLSPYWYLQIGRYLNCGLFLIIEKLGINPVLSQHTFSVLWFILLCLTIFILSCTIQVMLDCNNEFAVVCSTMITFLNVFMMELMLFPEVFLSNGIGLVALSLSIYFTLSSPKSPKKKLTSFVLLVIALGNYQSYIGIFESFALVYIFLKYKNNQTQRYKEYLYTLFIGGFASIFNVILVKILVFFNIIADSGRGTQLKIDTIIHNIKEIAIYQKSFWTNCDGLISGIWMPLIGISVLCLLFFIFRRVSNKIELFFLLIVIYLLSYAPHIIESSILLRPRSNIAIWSFISCVAILAIDIFQANTVRLTLVKGSVFFVLLINALFMNDIAANSRAVNCVDFIEADRIRDTIQTYESNTGAQIQKIAVSYDENPTTYHSFSKYKNGELGARILATDYSGYRLIGHKLGRSLEKVQMPESVYNEFFAAKNWDSLDTQSQVKCIGDTVYLVIY